VKVRADKQLAEAVPTGKFGGARPVPDEGALRRARLATLAAEVAAIDKSHAYGVNLRYQAPPPAAA
jgi:hypothetical protein